MWWKSSKGKRGKMREKEGRRGGTYSRRSVVIGGNFIILRHYPRYCNAIKLDTLRTPRGTEYLSLRDDSFGHTFIRLNKIEGGAHASSALFTEISYQAKLRATVLRASSLSRSRRPNQWLDKPVKPAGRGDGFEMSCAEPPLSVSSWNTVPAGFESGTRRGVIGLLAPLAPGCRQRLSSVRARQEFRSLVTFPPLARSRV